MKTHSHIDILLVIMYYYVLLCFVTSSVYKMWSYILYGLNNVKVMNYMDSEIQGWKQVLLLIM